MIVIACLRSVFFSLSLYCKIALVLATYYCMIVQQSEQSIIIRL